MELSTVLSIIIVLGIVWGGLAYFLIRAIKFEKIKFKNGED